MIKFDMELAYIEEILVFFFSSFESTQNIYIEREMETAVGSVANLFDENRWLLLYRIHFQ